MGKKPTWLRLVAVPAVLMLLAAACGDDDDTTAPEETTAPDDTAPEDTAAPDDTTAPDEGSDDVCTAERAGGEIVHLSGSAYSSMDPISFFGTGGYGGDLASAFYGTLTFYNAETDEYEPYIATSWEPNDDNSEWTVTIRDDVTFGNGDPFTTEHVAAAVARLSEGRTRGARLAAGVSTEVVDDTTIVFRAENGFNLPFMLSADVGWIPNMNVVEAQGDGFARNPVGAGAGAYEFESISDTPGESLVLVAKDDWWGGPVCVERIEFRNIADASAAVESFLNDESDTLYLGDVTLVLPVEEAGRLAFSQLVGAHQWVFEDQGRILEDSPFKDVRIREALQLALDYDVIDERIHNGEGPASTSAIIPEGSPYYTGAEGPPSDPDRARELVEETIAEGVWDGSFTYLHLPTAGSETAAVVFEALWEAVGMDVTLEADPNALIRTIIEPDFEVSSLGFAITPPHPFTNLSNLLCDNSGNRTGYCDPEMDAALIELQGAITIEENAAAIDRIQEIWNETFPYAIFSHTRWGIGARDHVHGLRFGSDNTVYFDRAYVES